MRGTSFLMAACLALATPATAGDFLIGGDYPLKPSPRISELFYESGMNCIRLTGGGYSWSVPDHKKLADNFEARGLKVYLQLGSHYPSADYFGMKDAWFVDHAGNTGHEDRQAWSITYSGHHWPQYSYAYLPFREKLEQDFTSYLSNFSGNKNVAGVILHNEPGFFWQTDRIYDYGQPSIEYFRKYLQKVHSDIATLNKVWGTQYASYDEVKPPGKPPVENIAAWMDWRRSQVQQIADFMSWESGFFKEQRADVPRTTNLAGPLDHWYGYRCADNHLFSTDMDAVGVDIYPTQWSSRALVPYTMDLSHGVAQGREVHVLECDVFSGKLWKDYSDAQRAEMLRGELWTMIGHGARVILVWGFQRGDDFSLTDGDVNERYLAAREIAHYGKMIDLSSFTRPRPRVAVCVDTDSYIYASGTEQKPHQLSPGEDSNAHGMYSMLADSQVPADVIFARQLTDDVAKNYGAILMAGSRMMDEKTADSLRAFNAGGGVVLADQPFATLDRWGQAFTEKPNLPEVTLLPERAGAKYMQQPDHAVRQQVLSAITPVLRTPRVRATPEGSTIDASLLSDDAANLLIVASTLGARGKAAPTLDDVKLSVWTKDPDAYTAAFVLSQASTSDDKIVSGPRPVKMDRGDDGAIVIELGQLRSATPVLLVTQSSPLLSVEAPTSARPGESILVRVTCHNPKRAAISGELTVLAGDIASPAPQIALSESASGDFKMTLEVPQTAKDRIVVRAQLKTADAQVLSIPIDVAIAP